ncbi:polymorphic toxin type 15 domain-containing protein [Clostridium acetobutylicum]
MNKLTVDEYLKNRERYIEEGRAIEGNMAQQAARDKALADKVDELRSSGMSLKEAETQAQNWLDTQAALHNPDQIAGGNPLNIGGMGDKGINSSIGAQWKYRIDAVDEQIQSMAKNMTDAERKSNYLNVKLTY